MRTALALVAGATAFQRPQLRTRAPALQARAGAYLEKDAGGLVGVGELARLARGAARAQGVPRLLAVLSLANDDHRAGFVPLRGVAKEPRLSQSNEHAVDAEPKSEEHVPTLGHVAHL